MSNAVELFQEGGFMMWVVLLFGALGLLMGAIHAASPQKWSLFAAGALLAVVLLAGVGGTLLGRRQVQAVLPLADPSERARIEEAGYRESMRPVQFAAGMVLPIGVLLLLGELRRGKLTSGS